MHDRCGDPRCLPCRLGREIDAAPAGGGLAGMKFRTRAQFGVCDLEWFEGPSIEEVCGHLQRLFGAGHLRVEAYSPAWEVPATGDQPAARILLQRRFSWASETRVYARAVVSEIVAGRNAYSIYNDWSVGEQSFSLIQALSEVHDRIVSSPVEEHFLAAARELNGSFERDQRLHWWHHEHWAVLPALVAEAHRRAGQPQPETARQLHERVRSVNEPCDVCGPTGRPVAMVVEVAEPFDWLPRSRPVRPGELGSGQVHGAWCAAHSGSVPAPNRLAEGWVLCRKQPGGSWVWEIPDPSGLDRILKGVRGLCDGTGCDRPAAQVVEPDNFTQGYFCEECADLFADFLKSYTWDETAGRWCQGDLCGGPWRSERVPVPVGPSSDLPSTHEHG